MCRSTMMAIMGRMSAYTGKQITWEQALASEGKSSAREIQLVPAAGGDDCEARGDEVCVNESEAIVCNYGVA